MRRKITLVMVPAGAVLLAAAFFAYSGASSEPRAAAATGAPPVVPVVAAPVTQGNVPIYLRGIGTAQAYNTVTIRSQITGQLTQIDFKQGQAVHKGNLLAVIDPRPYQAALDQAIANQARDQAQLANAEQLLQRDTPLLARGYQTAQAVETEKDQVAQYQAMVQSDSALIETARVNLGYTRLTSPIDGVTGIRQIDIGNIIHPTDPSGLVVVTQLQPISVIFTLPETDLPEIQQAMAKGQLAALAYSQDSKTALDRGTLDALDNQIIQTSGSVRLRANFPNSAHQLWPGELVDVRLLVKRLPNAITVAAAAVQQGPNGSYVYVVDRGGTVSARPVTVAQIGNKRAVISAGLDAGEEVVVNGQSRLQPGTPVKVVTGPALQEVADQSGPGMQIP